MIKNLHPSEVNRRRRDFSLLHFWIFWIGTLILAIAVVPIYSIYLRSWKPLIFWVAPLVVMSVLPIQGFGLSLFVGVILNTAYSFIIVKYMGHDLLCEDKDCNQEDFKKENTAEILIDCELELRILDILEEHKIISIGRICAYADSPYEQVNKILRYLVSNEIIKRHEDIAGIIAYSLK